MKQTMNYLKTNISTTIWRYYAFVFFFNAAFFSAVLIPFYTEWAKISITQIQILQSWFMLWIFLLDLPTGVIADHIGRKWTLTIGATIVAFATIVYGSFPDFNVFLLAELLFGIGIAFISGADQALLYDALKQAGKENDSKKIMGKADAIKYVAMLITAPIGSLIAAKFGTNAPMYLSFFPMILAAGVAFSIKEPVFHEINKLKENVIEKTIKGFEFLKNNPGVRGLAIDAILVATGSYFVIWFYQLLLTKIGVPIAYFGFAHMFLMGIEIVISANFARFEKFFGVAGFLRFTAIVTGASFVLVGLFPNFVTVIIFLVFAGGFGLTRLTFMHGHINQFIPSEKRATILSSISLFRRLALVIANPIAGMLADKSLSFALVIIALLPLSVGLFSYLKERKSTISSIKPNPNIQY